MTSRHLPGVHCDVTNCIYNDEGHACHADEIQVDHQMVESTNETDTFCGTFIAR